MLLLRAPVILASASPRRRELLAQLVPEFQVVPSEIEEDNSTWPTVSQTAEWLAEQKGLAVLALHPGAIIIAADTLVEVQENGIWETLGKPASIDDNRAMLRKLSGKAHRIATGVCILGPLSEQARSKDQDMPDDSVALATGWHRTFSVLTDVTFRGLSTQEIDEYVKSGEGLDKAGGYAIQGGAAAFVSDFEGSLSNVVGLPLERLEEELRALTC